MSPPYANIAGVCYRPVILTKEVEADVPKAEHNNTKLVKMIPDMPMAKKRVMMGEVDDMTCSSRSRAYPRPTAM